jgi:hypothetical protein
LEGAVSIVVLTEKKTTLDFRGPGWLQVMTSKLEVPQGAA